MRVEAAALTALLTLSVAGCGGSGSSTPAGSSNGNPPPTVTAPVITYGTARITLTVNEMATVPPTNTGGAATSWSMSPDLPAGLTFSAASGGISGVPTAASKPTSYTVTATNAAGSATATFTLGIQSVLLDLGHATDIHTLAFSGSRLFSMDNDAHWMLQDYASGTVVAEGAVPCTPATCNASVGPSPAVHGEIAGQTLVIQMPASLAVLSASDGSSLGTVGTIPTWWHVASDGSYICGGTNKALTAWAISGSVIASVSGDYSKALASCAPGVIRIASGPAGADVIQSVTLPSGSTSVSPQFQGTFNTWFTDGSAFITNAANTVWVYSNSGTQLDFAALTATCVQPQYFPGTLCEGEGPWFWTYQYTSAGTLDIYKVGNASAGPVATFTYPLEQPPLVTSGPTIAVLDGAVVHLIDLSGTAPTDADYTVPVAPPGNYAATSASQWAVSNAYGTILDGTSVRTTPRYLTYGTAWSIAGSTALAAVATASGKTLLFDTSTGKLTGTLNSSNSQIALSADGTVMAARASGDRGGTGDESVTTYSLPSGSVIHTWPYTYNSSPNPWPVDISLSSSGKLLGQVIFSGNTHSLTYTRMVTPSAGGPTLWSDSVSGDNPFGFQAWPLPILLSADDTLLAVSSSKDGNAGTNIYLNGTLSSAVAGWAVTWLPNDDLLVNTYSGTGSPVGYLGSTIYSPTGILQSSPPLPELGKGGTVQAVGTDSVYDPGTNEIYSLTTGAATWSGPPSNPVQTYAGVGAIAGQQVVFEMGSQIVAMPY